MLTDQSHSQHCRVWKKVWTKSCAAQCYSTSSKIDRVENMVTDPSYLLNAVSLNYAISHSYFTASYNWMTVHKVLERMWKEAVESWLKVLCRNFSGGTEKSHAKPVSERWVFQATLNCQISEIQITCFIEWVKLLCHWRYSQYCCYEWLK